MTVLVAAFGFMAVIRLMVPDQITRYLGPVIGIFLAISAWGFLLAGKLRAAVQWLAAGTWVLVTVVALFQGGVRTPAVVAYPVIVMLMGWLFSVRVAVATAGLTVAVIWGMVVAEALGLLPTPAVTPATMYGVIQAMVAVLAAFMVNFLIRSYNNRLDELSKAGQELARRTRELEASQSSLGIAIESTRMVFWEYDFVNDHLSYDETTMAWLGVTTVKAPHTLSDWLALLHPDDRAPFMVRFTQAIQPGEPAFEFDYRVGGHAGAWVWHHTRGMVVHRDAAGKPLLAGGGSLNITERKQVEESLRRSETLLRTMLESTEEGILMVTKEGRILSINQRFQALWRVPGDLVGTGLDDLLSLHMLDQLRDPAAFLEQVRRLYDSNAQARDTLHFKDGRVYARFTQALTIEGERGRIWCFKDITESSRAEAALAVSRNLLQTVIDTAPMRVFWKDQTLQYMGCNPAFAHDAGLSHPDELMGKRDAELSWKEQAERYGADDRRVMDSGVPQYSYDEPQTTPEGHVIWLRTSKVPLRNEASEIMGVLGIYEDITERKQAEIALRDSEARALGLANMLRLLCDNVPDMIWAKDLNKRYIFANKAVCDELLGADDTREPVGKDDLFFALRERQRYPGNAQWHTFGELCQDSDVVTLQNAKASQFDEFGNVRGTFMFLDVHKAPFLDERGAVIGVVGSARNVTQQKVAEDKLQLAALVLENSSEAMMIVNADNRVLEINPAFTRVTGYSRDEILGQTPSVLNSGRQTPEFYRAMWQALTTSGQWQGEIWNRSKDGRFIAEWLTISTLYTKGGAVHRRVALFSDITEKKKADELVWVHANFDMLTQLPNRRMFHDRLTQELKKVQRSGLKLALFFLDLDHFKEVNDTLGHDKGDVLLMEAARRIVACVRETDTVARMGGDEFTVILTEIDDPGSVDRVAQSIVLALDQPFQIGPDLARVSASLGIALYPHDATEADELLKNADQAMYAAKSAGRNRFSYFISN